MQTHSYDNIQMRSPPKGTDSSCISIDKSLLSSWRQLRERFRVLQREVTRWMEMQDAVLEAVVRIRQAIGADIDSIRHATVDLR
jgi:hypothetical protein